MFGTFANLKKRKIVMSDGFSRARDEERQQEKMEKLSYYDEKESELVKLVKELYEVNDRT